MAKPKYIGLEQLANASLDAESWGLFINGDEFTDVITRLGRQYPTIAKWLKESMMSSGWKAYQTEAELLATVPDEINTVAYAFDTKKLYIWNGSEWMDEGLSSIDLANAYTDFVVNQLGISKSNNKYAFDIHDSVGKVAFAISHNGDMLLNNTSYRQELTQYSYVIARDGNGKIAAAVDKDGNAILGQAKIKATSANHAFSICDATGRAAFSIEKNGDIALDKTLYRQEFTQFSHIIARDGIGQIAAAIDKNGSVILGQARIRAENSGYVFSICDSLNQIALAVNKDGSIITSEQKEEIKKQRWHKADVMFVASLGQSLSKGRNSLPIKNTTQPYKNITFKSGELRNESSADYSDFKPLVGEQIDAYYGESPNIWHLNKFVENRASEGGDADNWVFLGTAPQAGGTPMQGLNKGSYWYNQYIKQVQAAYDLCQSQGKSFVVSHNTWTQGENDYSLDVSKDAYKYELIKLKNDIADDIMAITRQKFRPILITYQCPAHRNYGGNKNYNNVAQAQFEAQIEDDEIFMACPIYHFKFHTDNVHLTSDGSQMLGYYYARASEAILLKNENWRPLMPISVNHQGKIIDITFNVPFGELVFDTDLVTEAANMGFDIWFGKDTLLNIIDSVEITDKDRVKIILSESPPKDAIISYARGRAEEGAVTSSANRPRGNLRDIAGDEDNYINTSGEPSYLHNWCVMFNINLNFGV